MCSLGGGTLVTLNPHIRRDGLGLLFYWELSIGIKVNRVNIKPQKKIVLLEWVKCVSLICSPLERVSRRHWACQLRTPPTPDTSLFIPLDIGYTININAQSFHLQIVCSEWHSEIVRLSLILAKLTEVRLCVRLETPLWEWPGTPARYSLACKISNSSFEGSDTQHLHCPVVYPACMAVWRTIMFVWNKQIIRLR